MVPQGKVLLFVHIQQEEIDKWTARSKSKDGKYLKGDCARMVSKGKARKDELDGKIEVYRARLNALADDAWDNMYTYNSLAFFHALAIRQNKESVL